MNDTIYVAQKTLQDFNNIDSTFSVKDWVFIVIAVINLIILIVTLKHIENSPIKAVEVADDLQTNRSNSDRIYNNKFYVFATILGYRHALGWDEQFVVAINQIPIVFHENIKVTAKLKLFIDKHKDVKITDDLNSCLNDLIIEIGRDLGYDNIDNSLISSDYFRPDSSFYRYKAEEIRNHEFVQEREPKSENVVHQAK